MRGARHITKEKEVVIPEEVDAPMSIDRLVSTLACPEKHHPLQLINKETLICRICNKEFQIKDGIPVLLSDEQLTVEERWWEWSPTPLVDHMFMRGTDPHNQPIRCSIRDKAKNIGNSALEVGCATCIDYPLYREAKLYYIGTDLTYKLLAGAKTHTPQVPVVQGDAKRLPFKSESFDVVFCKDVIEHLKPYAYTAVLQEMWRVARKAVMIGFYGHYQEVANASSYMTSEIRPDVGYCFSSYLSYTCKADLMKVIDNLPNYGSLTDERVPFENLPSGCSDYRNLYIITKN